jgi:hypothetical protein
MEPIQAWWYQKLQNGEISPCDHWTLVSTASAYEDYTQTVSKMGAGIRKCNETGFGMALRKLLPEGWPKKKKMKSASMFVDKQVNHYELPHLDVCREYFEGLIGANLPWDDVPLEAEIIPCIEDDDL